MARRLRIDTGGIVYHVINRRVGKATLFEKDFDYAAFDTVLAEACTKWPNLRVVSYCLMPTHWHLVLWPKTDGELSKFMQWLTVTHMRRWHAHRDSAGTGPVYQGRFKSFPIEEDGHLLTVCRYVERNALRAGHVKRAEDWPWGSLSGRHTKQWLLPLTQWPVDVGRTWTNLVNRPQTPAEEDALRKSVNRGIPFGNPNWQKRIASRLGLESTFRDPWRPKKIKTKNRNAFKNIQ